MGTAESCADSTKVCRAALTSLLAIHKPPHLSPTSPCPLLSGVEVSLPNIVSGLKFSWPIYKSGFQVLIASNVEEGGIWAFAQVGCSSK